MPFHYVAFPSLFILNTVDSLFYGVISQFHHFASKGENIKKIASTKYLSYFIKLKSVQKI